MKARYTVGCETRLFSECANNWLFVKGIVLRLLGFLLWFIILGGLTSGTDVGTEVSHATEAASHYPRGFRYQLAGIPVAFIFIKHLSIAQYSLDGY